MNDNEFQERAFANPWDDTPGFLAAAEASEERRALLTALQQQDGDLKTALAAPVPAGLKEKLLAIAEEDPGLAEDQAPASTAGHAGDDNVIRPPAWRWQKFLPLAASLVVGLAVIFNLVPDSRNEVLANDILGHLHAELGFLDSNTPVSRTELNEHLEEHGGRFADTTAMNALDAQGIFDCWIEKDQTTHFHMVMPGEVGVVTVIVMSGEPIEGSIALDDERFDGIVLPTPKGNLVVAGEKGEPVEQHAELLLANLEW